MGSTPLRRMESVLCFTILVVWQQLAGCAEFVSFQTLTTYEIKEFRLLQDMSV